jgi:hypothetical protein
MAPPRAAQKPQRRRNRLLRLLGGLALLAPLEATRALSNQ